MIILIKSVEGRAVPEYDEVSVYFEQLGYTDVFAATGFDESIASEYTYGGDSYQSELIRFTA